MENTSLYEEVALDMEEFDATIKELRKDNKPVDKRLLAAYENAYKICRQVEGISTEDYVKFVKNVIFDKFKTSKVLVNHRDFLDNYMLYFNSIDRKTGKRREIGCEFNGEFGESNPSDGIQLLSQRLERTTFVRMNPTNQKDICADIEKIFHNAYNAICQRRFEDINNGINQPWSYYLDSPEVS